MIAFALTAYDNNREPIEDPSFGTIKAYYKTWGLEESVQGIAFEEVPTTMCTKEQLSIRDTPESAENESGSRGDDGNEENLFYEMHETAV